jgi:hypothetical protein
VNGLQRISKTSRLSQPEAAAAYLSDLWSEAWERKDGMWQITPKLDPGPASWGIEALPIRRADSWIVAEARREGWDG